MITAVDTSVILDILGESQHFADSMSLFRLAGEQGKLVVCPLVWAELRPCFQTDHELENVLQKMDLNYDELNQKIAHLAGKYWKEYRKNKGSRSRIIADFIIGAHAALNADRLLTRDRGFYKNYFKGLKILDKN